MNKGKYIRIGVIASLFMLFSGAHLGYLKHFEQSGDPHFLFELFAQTAASGEGKYYPFINYTRNFVEWKNNDNIKGFFKKFQQTQRHKLKILHIGDSHLQADIFSGYIREEMQNSFGAGGRGLVFPYAAAKTHSARDYYSYATGHWEYAKNTQEDPRHSLGLSGVTVYTEMHSASFKFVFKPHIIRSNFTTIRLLCKKSENSFDVQLKYAQHAEPILIDCSKNPDRSYVEVYLPHASDTLEFIVTQTRPEQWYFECYGVMIDSDANKGVQYNTVGINGAGYKSILRQKLFASQLRDLDPDLVIIDLGANDFYMTDLRRDDVTRNLSAIIQQIQLATDHRAMVMVSNAMDIVCKTQNASAIFSEITRVTAFAHHCLFYDFYQVSGGKNGMLQWEADSLSKADRIHLNPAGYQLKGELYLNGLLNSYQMYRSNKNLLTFTADKKPSTDITESTMQQPLPPDSHSVFPADNLPGKAASGIDTVYYQTSEGESLEAVAARYGVEAYQIRRWNNIPDGEHMITNSLLIIYTKLKTNE